MTGNVTITLTLTLKPEAIEGFCAVMPDMLQDTAKFAGFKDIRILRHKEQNQMIFIETWESEAHYNAYLAWRAETGAMDSMGEILAAPPQMDVWPFLIASL